jgi:hypothetical protein
MVVREKSAEKIKASSKKDGGTYEQALRGLFTAGTSSLVSEKQRKRSVSKRGLKSFLRTPNAGLHGIVLLTIGA